MNFHLDERDYILKGFALNHVAKRKEATGEFYNAFAIDEIPKNVLKALNADGILFTNKFSDFAPMKHDMMLEYLNNIVRDLVILVPGQDLDLKV